MPPSQSTAWQKFRPRRVIMADVNLADLDKAVKLVETAMKTDAKNAKLREQQRAKAEAALEAFKDNYAKSGREGNATKKQILTDLEKAVGIAENELDDD